MKRIYVAISIVMTILSLTSCKESIDDFLGIAPDMEGEAVAFTTDLRTPHSNTRAAFETKDAMDTELGSYKAINKNYDLTISMFKKGDDTPVKTSKFSPTPDGSGFNAKGNLSLQAQNPVIYWPDNVNEYGFKVTCGTENVAEDQSTAENFLAQDALLGYGYAASYGDDADDIEEMNYHTNKEWYAKNKARLEGMDGYTTDDYRRIPLYLRHQRSWITVILKAGTGVKRELLQEANSAKLTTTLFSHGDPKVTIQPLRSYTTIDYAADINGEAGSFQTTQFDAIVDPYNYSTNLETEICKIVVDDMKFTYYAHNDAKYNENPAADMSAYNLTAGKHLIITATLSTDRVAHITALLEDWDEMTFNSICDDYGKDGQPIEIKSTEELISFLGDTEKNKAGNTAIISAASLDLTKVTWDSSYDLKASLNLAGATITTNKQFLNSIYKNATLVNGVIRLTGSTDQGSAVCSENHGTIQQVNITSDGNAKVTKGAVCDVNYGTIFNCTSYLAVQGTGSYEYVGGIAATSMWADDGLSQPIIDKCIVNGRVGAETSSTVLGVGGIVGYAEGRLSNNTFNYGITISYQNIEKYKNIVAATSSDGNKALGGHAYNNAWPTTVSNDIAGNNDTPEASRYQGVLDCQTELEQLIKLGTTASNKRYRIAADFDVDNTWSYGQTEASGSEWFKEPTSPIYNHTFILDGNNHTITTHGKMLFSHINGEIMNLKVYCAESIEEDPNSTSTNVIAPLAYSVNGANAKLTNVKVRMASGTYIQASQPSGLVCCAFDGAVIKDCEVQVTLKSKMQEGDTTADDEFHDARRYMGGLAAFATKAEFVGCKAHIGTTMTEISTTKHTNFYCGGIVGGVTIKNNTDPSLLIHDCYSWCKNDGEIAHFGAIIGRTKFTMNNAETNGMREGCQGNWWQDGNPAGDLDNKYEKILGKKNSVNPGTDSDWWN